MRVMSSGRCVMLALAVAVCTSACAKDPARESAAKGHSAATSGATSRTVNGLTFTDAPVVASLGPHRFAFPANYYDDQIGPYPGGGVGITLMWPDMVPGEPGANRSRTREEHYRSVVYSIDFIDRVPIVGSIELSTSTEATTPEDSVFRRDPTRRLDMRIEGDRVMGLTPYRVDPKRMDTFSEEYKNYFGTEYDRHDETEDVWYINRGNDGTISTFIKCGTPQGGVDDAVLIGAKVVPGAGKKVAHCMHYIIDERDSLSIRIVYSLVLLKDWQKMERAIRSTLARYRES